MALKEPANTYGRGLMTSVTDEHYSNRVALSDDLLWQVGKTVNGSIVGTDQIELIVKRICSALDLKSGDRVLDVGSGNGLLTRLIAPHCKEVIGIERNSALCSKAIQLSAGPNISYLCQSLDELDFKSLNCNKVLLYEVVQHLDYCAIVKFLRSVFEELPDHGAVLLGGIPSELEKWTFYEGRSRREGYFRALAEGADVMGTWYHPEFFEYVAHDLQLSCKIMPQSSQLYTSYYRFDCLLEKPRL